MNNHCPCCREAYSDRFGQDRVLLDCLHPICRACLRLAHDLFLAISNGSNRSNGYFLCPFCHTRTTFEVLKPPPPSPPVRKSPTLSAVGRRRRFRSGGRAGLIASISECTLSGWPSEEGEEEDKRSVHRKR